MTEQKFESKFHKQYVGGEGVVEDKGFVNLDKNDEIIPEKIEDILREYRKYVNDPKAELPEAIVEELRMLGKI